MAVKPTVELSTYVCNIFMTADTTYFDQSNRSET